MGRGSAVRLRSAVALEELGGRVVLGVAYDGDTASVGANEIAFGDAGFGVVGALGLDFGMNLADECAGIGFAEDDDCVDIGERGDDFSALVLGHERTVIAFDSANGGIGVDGDDESASERFGSVQVADVSDVQQIEASIGENDLLASFAPCGDSFAQLGAGDDFVGVGGQRWIVSKLAVEVVARVFNYEDPTLDRFAVERGAQR